MEVSDLKQKRDSDRHTSNKKKNAQFNRIPRHASPCTCKKFGNSAKIKFCPWCNPGLSRKQEEKKYNRKQGKYDLALEVEKMNLNFDKVDVEKNLSSQESQNLQDGSD